MLLSSQFFFYLGAHGKGCFLALQGKPQSLLFLQVLWYLVLVFSFPSALCAQ